MKQKQKKSAPISEPQGQLVDVSGEEKNPAVVGKKMKVHFVKPHFDFDKKGERIIDFEFTLPLVKAHDGLLPNRVKQGWNFMAKKGYPRIDIDGIPGQRAAFYLTHDDPTEQIVLHSRPTHVALKVIEETGEGAAKKVIRFQFRLGAKLTKDVAHFAEFTYGTDLYMQMTESQEKLWDDEDDENGDEE